MSTASPTQPRDDQAPDGGIWPVLPSHYQQTAARRLLSVDVSASVISADELVTGASYYDAAFYLDFPLCDMDSPVVRLLAQAGGWPEDALGSLRMPVGQASALVLDMSCEPRDVLPYLEHDEGGLPELGFTMLDLRREALAALAGNGTHSSVPDEASCDAMVLVEQVRVAAPWRGAEIRLAALGMTLQLLGQGRRVAAIQPDRIDPDDSRSSAMRDLRRLGFQPRTPQVMAMAPDPVRIFSVLNAAMPG